MSKRLIVVSLLMLLISACSSQFTVLTPPAGEVQNTQPVFPNTLEPFPTATATPLILAATALPTSAPMCADSPTRHVVVGQQVTVMADDSDKLKLRSNPGISPDTVTRELDQFTQLTVVQGPVCVYSDETGTFYWFWKVKVISSGEIGWVAEGDSVHYFIESSTPVVEATAVVCTDAVTRVAIGQKVTVITEDTDKLKLRKTPVLSPDTVVMELDKFTKLTSLDGPVCAYSEETSICY